MTGTRDSNLPVANKLNPPQGNSEDLSNWETFSEDHLKDAQGLKVEDGLLSEPISRRDFLALMGASLALAGTVGCRRPIERIVPYQKQPEEIVLGEILTYATTMPLGGLTQGVLISTREGRPIKIEGNPYHPSSQGGTSVWAQASILDLYDPDRLNQVYHSGSPSSWEAFAQWWKERLFHYQRNGGEGLVLISEVLESPTFSRLIREFKEVFPRAHFIPLEAVGRGNQARGLKMVTGQLLLPYYQISSCQTILSLDADFLHTEADAVRNAGEWAEARDVEKRGDDMVRLYIAESTYTVTGSVADHRLALPVREIGKLAVRIALHLYRYLGDPLLSDIAEIGQNLTVDPSVDRWAEVVAQELSSHRKRGLIIAGEHLPPPFHSLTATMNEALGNRGTVLFYRSLESDDTALGIDPKDLNHLFTALDPHTIIYIGENPEYYFPQLRVLLSPNGREVVQLSRYGGEEGLRKTWLLPRAHYLESWGDIVGPRGDFSILQPLIEPLYGGRSEWELVATLLHGDLIRGYELVRQTWQRRWKETDFESRWTKALNDGITGDVLPPIEALALRREGLAENLMSIVEGNISNTPLELVVRLSPAIYDGRFANNAWLQELPQPLTNLTWDNTILISPSDAQNWGLENGDVVQIEVGEAKEEGPVWVLPGHPPGSVTLFLGYGQKGIGRVAEGVGLSGYNLIAEMEGNFVGRCRMKLTGRRHKLASTQEHWSMENRRLIREGLLTLYLTDDKLFHDPEPGAGPSLWKEHRYDEGYQWGMVVDLNACIGCGACIIACQSENNIPVVGKEQVWRNREMHWIRVDRYFEGDPNNPRTHHQPVMCQHCEMAPCEQVCPVAATNHDSEGLNVMTYNRCVGTRYCANNCPYKVRRFNFFNYTRDLPYTLQLVQNPDVTVRSRGVMEKCTYCIQRINRAKRQAKLEGRGIQDGDIVTACQAACPTRAITFGNINDPQSRVAQLKRIPRNYELLAYLNTRPRTSYLGRIRNANPLLLKGDEEEMVEQG